MSADPARGSDHRAVHSQLPTPYALIRSGRPTAGRRPPTFLALLVTRLADKIQSRLDEVPSRETLNHMLIGAYALAALVCGVAFVVGAIVLEACT